MYAVCQSPAIVAKKKKKISDASASIHPDTNVVNFTSTIQSLNISILDNGHLVIVKLVPFVCEKKKRLMIIINASLSRMIQSDLPSAFLTQAM